MDSVPPHAPFTAPPPVRYAGFWLRWAAYTIDGIIVSIPIAVIMIFATVAGIAQPGGGDPSPAAIVFLLLFVPFAIVLGWLYGALQESSAAQATFGKRLLGLKVTDYAGGRIGFGRASGRFWAKILSGIPGNIGYIMAAFTERKQALHDMLVKTLVVRR